MKNLGKIYFLLMVIILASCSDHKDTNQKEENELKSTFEAYIDAFNHKDYNKMASFWAEDATLQNPITGETAEGRSEIEDYFKHKFENNQNEKILKTNENITLTNSEEATIKAAFQISEENEVKIAGKILIDFVKEDDGKWYILKYREFEKMDPVSHFEKLEKLNWLVGNWIDESDDVEIHSNWSWDKNKNFLTERFTMKVLDENEFEGFQIFGWDPAQEKIHVWMFDSDGGFGNGTMTEEHNHWYVSMVFTLPDGQIGSSTNIYEKLDDDSYTFSSIARDIEGTVLPNVGPYEIKRIR